MKIESLEEKNLGKGMHRLLNHHTKEKELFLK